MTVSLQFSANEVATKQTWNLAADDNSFFRKAAKVINILATETYATCRYVLPASITWVWRKYICNDIKTIEIKAENTNRYAYLNIHGKLPSINNKKVHAVLLTHGDFGHPYTMLHLADIAHKQGIATFSLYIPGVENNQQFEVHNELLKQSIDKIETLIRKNNGNFSGILGAGHSKGSILLAQRQFVNLDPRIKAMCAIGGRLNIPNEKDPSDQYLVGIVKNIYKSIINNPEKPLVQIVPDEDWCVSQEAMAVRPNDHCYSVPGMHLSGLFKTETRNHFTLFINEFLQ